MHWFWDLKAALCQSSEWPLLVTAYMTSCENNSKSLLSIIFQTMYL